MIHTLLIRMVYSNELQQDAKSIFSYAFIG